MGGGSDEGRADLRTFLRANMLDGEESGRVTMRASDLLDEICDLVGIWIRDDTPDDPARTLTFVEVLDHFGLTEADLKP
jgi:hypothetical protein